MLSKKRGQAAMPRTSKGFCKLQITLFVGWILALAVFILALALFPTPKPDTDANLTREKRGPLKVFTGKGIYYSELSREKAVEFGLEKLYSVVNYFLLATAALLAFIVKSVMDIWTNLVKNPTANGGAAQPGISAQLLLFLHSGIASVLALCCGAMAYLYLPGISNAKEFCLTAEISICLLAQMFMLLFSIVLLTVALANVVRDLIT
jgi:hypothetical protein